jgi:hypothetical protein
MKTYQKVLAALVLFLLLFITAIHIYSTYYLEDQIKETLITEINRNSDGKYTFSIGDLNLSFLQRTIRLNEISINTTEDATQELHVELHSMSLSGIGLRKLLFSREINIDKIFIERPSIRIRKDSSETTDSNTKSMLQRAAEASSTVLTNIVIPEIEINDFDFEIYRESGQVPYLSFSNSELTLSGISLMEASENGTMPFENSSGRFRDITYYTENGLYSIQGASAQFSSMSQSASADSILLTPLLDPSDFFETVGHRTDRMTGFVRSVALDGFDITALLNVDTLISENLFIEQPELTLFRDKNYPRKENRGIKPLPQEILHELNFPVILDVVSIENASVRYSEIAENATETGYIEFTDLDARLLNTTNVDSLIAKNSNWTLQANTRVMDTGELDVSFQFPMNENYHTITGQLKQMSARDLNHALEPIAAVRIESGNISGLRFEMRVNKTEAVGFLEVIYDDLKISVLDGETGDKNLRSRITSFLANSLKIKKENLAENPRMGAISYQREPDKSFFNYWWKSLRTGLKTSVGLDD